MLNSVLTMERLDFKSFHDPRTKPSYSNNLLKWEQSAEKGEFKDSHCRLWIIRGLIVMSLSLVAVFGVINFGVVYIQQVQVKYLSLLDDRIKAMEKEYEDGSYQDQQILGDYIPVEQSHVRLKRNYNNEESQHRRKMHHGIASFNIAWVYGNASKVEQNATNQNVDLVLEKFRWRQVQNYIVCNSPGVEVYIRGDGQVFCTEHIVANRNSTMPGSYRTSEDEKKFHYFETASWMSQPDAKDHFTLLSDGAIKVLKSGIYMLQTSIHFVNVGQLADIEFNVYKKTFEYQEVLIAECKIPVITNRDGVYPCLASQLAYIRADEKIYLTIGAYSWFRVNMETFYISLIKLTGENI